MPLLSTVTILWPRFKFCDDNIDDNAKGITITFPLKNGRAESDSLTRAEVVL